VVFKYCLAEILLKVALKTKQSINQSIKFFLLCCFFHFTQYITVKHSILPRQNTVKPTSQTASIHKEVHKQFTWYKITLRFYVYNHSCIAVNIRYWDKSWYLFNIRWKSNTVRYLYMSLKTLYYTTWTFWRINKCF